MNYLMWFELVTRLAGVVARESGAAPRELAYLSLLSSGVQTVALTDADLTDLKAKYEAEVGTPVSVGELDDIAARIAARSARIQGG